MKFQVPSLLSTNAPNPAEISRSVAVSNELSISAALASRSAWVITRKPLSSAIGVSTTDAVVGVSLTLTTRITSVLTGESSSPSFATKFTIRSDSSGFSDMFSNSILVSAAAKSCRVTDSVVSAVSVNRIEPSPESVVAGMPVTEMPVAARAASFTCRISPSLPLVSSTVTDSI